jgi:hypothetical protein
MPDLNASRTKHKSILSSLNALGASELPVTTNSVPRNGVLASVAAAGVSLLACQSADAGTISVFNPNVNVGFAAGDINIFKLDIASLQGSGFNLDERTFGHRLVELGPNPLSVSVRMTAAAGVAAPGAYGKKFSQIGTYATILTVLLEGRFTGGGAQGSNFSDEYYAFSFEDTSSQTHYGWIYGTLSGTYSDLTYNLISYAYDTTPGVEIGMGFTGASTTPEPSTAALGAMAALILGAAGVRKWNKAQV